MDKKKCTACKKSKLLTEYRFRNKAAGILQTQCKDCCRKDGKKHYKQNKNDVVTKVLQRNAVYIKRFYDYKKTLSCACCSETESVCLDFHHRDPSQKDFVVSEMVGRKGWPTLMREINKCVCLCANCHRKVHKGILTLPL